MCTYIYIYVHTYVCRKRGKKGKKDIFDGLFIFQHISTLRFGQNTKILYQNYFCMRNDSYRYFFFYSVGNLLQGL